MVWYHSSLASTVHSPHTGLVIPRPTHSKPTRDEVVLSGPTRSAIKRARPCRTKWSYQDQHFMTKIVLVRPLWSWPDHNWQLWSGQDHNWQLWSGQDHNWQVVVRPGPQLAIMVRPGPQLAIMVRQDHNWQVVVRPGPQVPKKLKHKRAWSCTLFWFVLDLRTLILELFGLVHTSLVWAGHVTTVVVRPGPQLAIMGLVGPQLAMMVLEGPQLANVVRPGPQQAIMVRPIP